MGFDISFREYHNIEDPNDLEPLDWYYLVNRSDEQRHEWSIDTADRLTMFFESTNYVGYQNSAPMPRVSKFLITRDSAKYWRSDGTLNSADTTSVLQAAQLDSLVLDVLDNGLTDFGMPTSVGDYIQTLQDEGYTVSVGPTGVVYAATADDSIRYDPALQHLYRDVYENGKLLSAQFTLYESDAESRKLPTVEIERIPLVLPSGACAEKIVQKLYRNYTLFDDVGGALRPTSLRDPSESPLSFRLFPNPTHRGLLHLALNGTTAGTMLVQVTDMTGRTMLSHTIEVLPGSSLVPLDVSALPSGRYAVVVATSGHLHTEILSIQ